MTHWPALFSMCKKISQSGTMADGVTITSAPTVCSPQGQMLESECLLSLPDSIARRIYGISPLMRGK